MAWGTQQWGQTSWGGISDAINPTIINNSPTGIVSIGVTPIRFRTTDTGGAGVDIDTINLTVNSEFAVLNGVVQSGWIGTVSANTSDGYDVYIVKDGGLPYYSSYTMIASCSDLVGNPATPLEWFFILTGNSATSALAINENTVRVSFDNPVKQSIATELDDALNPLNYDITGGFRKISATSVSSVDDSTVDLTVPEMTDTASYSLVASASIGEPVAVGVVSTEEDVPSPRVIYNSATTVDVELPFSALGNSVGYKLQDGTTYAFSGGEQCVINASGLNGLDTGSEANNTWYHLYLVPDGTDLKPIFSASAPGTGPSGYTEFLPIGVIFNNNSGDIAEFDYAGAWHFIRELEQQPRLFSVSAANITLNTWYEIPLDDTTQVTGAANADGWVAEGVSVVPTGFPGYPTEVIDAMKIQAFMDEDSGGTSIYVRGGDTRPTEVLTGGWGTGGYAIVESNTATTGHAEVSLPSANLYWICAGNGATVDCAFRGVAFRHKYRVG